MLWSPSETSSRVDLGVLLLLLVSDMAAEPRKRQGSSIINGSVWFEAGNLARHDESRRDGLMSRKKDEEGHMRSHYLVFPPASLPKVFISFSTSAEIFDSDFLSWEKSKLWVEAGGSRSIQP